MKAWKPIRDDFCSLVMSILSSLRVFLYFPVLVSSITLWASSMKCDSALTAISMSGLLWQGRGCSSAEFPTQDSGSSDGTGGLEEMCVPDGIQSCAEGRASDFTGPPATAGGKRGLPGGGLTSSVGAVPFGAGLLGAATPCPLPAAPRETRRIWGSGETWTRWRLARTSRDPGCTTGDSGLATGGSGSSFRKGTHAAGSPDDDGWKTPEVSGPSYSGGIPTPPQGEICIARTPKEPLLQIWKTRSFPKRLSRSTPLRSSQ